MNKNGEEKTEVIEYKILSKWDLRTGYGDCSLTSVIDDHLENYEVNVKEIVKRKKLIIILKYGTI